MKKYLLLVVILFAVASASAQFSNTSTSKSRSSSSDLTFCGGFSAGVAIGNTKYDNEKLDGTMVAPVFTGTYGVKLNDYLFIGAGIGIKYMTQNWKESYGDYDYAEEYKYTISSLMLPLYAELKVFLPVNETVSPFVMADFGYSVRLAGEFKSDYRYDDYYHGYIYTNTHKSDTKGGLCYKFGAGVAINSFTLALGYDCQKFGVNGVNKDFNTSSFFFSVGYAF